MDAITGSICAEGITGKQAFIEFYRIKGGINEIGIEVCRMHKFLAI